MNQVAEFWELSEHLSENTKFMIADLKNSNKDLMFKSKTYLWVQTSLGFVGKAHRGRVSW